MQHVYLYSSIIFNVLTNVGFNLSAIYDKDPVKRWGFFAIGLVFGLINSYLFTECLKGISLQVASAVFFSLTVVGLYLAAHFGFHEKVSASSMVGVAFILAGVVIVSLNK